MIHTNFLHSAVEVGFDFSVRDAILQVRFDPVLDVAVKLRAAIDERHARSVPPQVESGDGGGVLAANYQNVAVVVRMRLSVIMRNLRQVLARQSELISQVIVAGRNNHFARAVIVRASGTVCGGDAEVSVVPHDRFDPFVLANIQLIVFGDLAIVLERFFTGRFLMGRGKWNLADLESSSGVVKTACQRDSEKANSPDSLCRRQSP